MDFFYIKMNYIVNKKSVLIFKMFYFWYDSYYFLLYFKFFLWKLIRKDKWIMNCMFEYFKLYVKVY